MAGQRAADGRRVDRLTPPVAILLATYNGARFLPDQLDSLVAQTVPWRLYWRDDGSTDGTVPLMTAFLAGPAVGRAEHVPGSPGRIGPTRTFMTLLRAAAPTGATVAFADQDDVWLPEKLARGLAGLAPHAGPALYCSRQYLVDAELRPLAVSAPLRTAPDFPAALAQNIATGCTVMLNPAAAQLIAGSQPPTATLHDWWSYLLVSAAGGALVVDATPTVKYRQHGSNVVGAPRSMRRRAVAALARGPDMFMNILRAHVAALRAHRALLSPEAASVVERIHAGLYGGWRERRAALRVLGLRRQTWQETALFRWWFMIG